MDANEDIKPDDMTQAFKELAKVAAPILAVGSEQLAAMSEEERAAHDAQMKSLEDAIGVLNEKSREQALEAQDKHLMRAAVEMKFIPG